MMKKKKEKLDEITIDATGIPYGRLASRVASIVRGKSSASFKPHVIAPVSVKIQNVDKVIFTGKKFTQKVYYRHSGYPGGIKTKSLRDAFIKNPSEIFLQTIKGMLPKTKHRNVLMTRIKFE